MNRVAIALGVTLVLLLASVAFAQTGAPSARSGRDGVEIKPDFSGTWRFNQAKSSPGTAGNTPNIAFASQLVIKQSAADLYVNATSVRQAPFTATYKLDGSKVTVEAPRGITEVGDAKFEGASLVINTRRSFTSPLGETVITFKEVWTLNGNVLTIEKTRIEEGESFSEKGVYDKMQGA